MVLVTVLVPPGVGPGGQLQLESPYGGRFAVNVPEGVSPGQMMHVHVPGPTGGAEQMPPSQPFAPVEASEEDVAQLAAIFPDIDNEVLVLILETCGGTSAEARLEEAISQLLDMSGDASSPPLTPPHLPSPPPAHAEAGLSQMEADERMARELAAEMGQHNIDADEASLAAAQTPSLALPRPRPAVRLPPQRRHRCLRVCVCAQELAWQLSRELARQDGAGSQRVAPPASMSPGMPNANPGGGQPPSALGSALDSPLSPSAQQRDAFPPPAAPSSRGRPTTAKLRQLKASLSAKKREANAKVDAMRKGGLARGMSMRGSRNGDGGGALLLGVPDEADEVSPDGGLAGEEMGGGGGGSYAAPEVPTISREQFERDFANEPLRSASSGGVAADAATPVVAKPVPVEQYNSRVGRARVANAARIHARSHACTLDPATVASMDGSQPGTVPPPAPAAVAAAAAPPSLMD